MPVTISLFRIKTAGRPNPRIVASIPTAIVSNKNSAIARINKGMEMYGQLDSYRAMLDREGASGPADIAFIGDEAELRRKIQRLRDIGVSDLNCPFSVLATTTRQRNFSPMNFKTDGEGDLLPTEQKLASGVKLMWSRLH